MIEYADKKGWTKERIAQVIKRIKQQEQEERQFKEKEAKLLKETELLKKRLALKMRLTRLG